MQRVHAWHYVAIGKILQLLSAPFGDSSVQVFPTPRLDENNRDWVVEQLGIISTHCGQLKLSVSAEFLQTYIVRFGQALPSTADVKNFVEFFDVTFNAELQKRLFVFVPPERADTFDRDMLFGEMVEIGFPSASREIREAGNCYALGLNTACVFHCMRTLESGLRCLADRFGLKFELEQWQNVIEQIESKIEVLKSMPKSMQRVEDQEFYSKAAMQFAYFKDAWRNHVMHGRRSYDENEALRVFEHTGDFMLHLATKMHE